MRWTPGAVVVLTFWAVATTARAEVNGMESKLPAKATAVSASSTWWDDADSPKAPDPDVVTAPEAAATEVTTEPAAAAETLTDPAPVYVPRRCTQCAAPAPWKLPQPCVFQRLGVDMGGWVQQGITFNGNGSGDGFNGPVATNDFANEYQMNQTWLYFSRPTNTLDGGFDVGGRVDLVYGTDWRFGKCYGLEDRIDSADGYYGMVAAQFYGEVAYNDLTVKMGHYATRFGYEGVPAVTNFFYSHSYAMCYTEPLLVTGLEADWRLTDRFSLVGGFNRGWMMFEDYNDNLDFLGGFLWTSDSKNTSVKFMTTTGPQDVAGENNRFAYSLLLQQNLTQKLKYVLQNNLGYEDNADPRTGADGEWYGVNQYLFYTLSPKWTVGGRFEWLRDDDGSRVAGIGNWIGSDKGWDAAPGFAGDFFEVSLGLNWRPHPNFLIRPEVRYDWYDGTTNLAGELPFDSGKSDNQATVAADLIVTF